MLKSSVNNIKIKGISCVVPKNEISFINDKTLYNGNEAQLKKNNDVFWFQY